MLRYGYPSQMMTFYNVLFKMCLDWDQNVFEWICELNYKSTDGKDSKYSMDCKTDEAGECKPFL